MRFKVTKTYYVEAADAGEATRVDLPQESVKYDVKAISKLRKNTRAWRSAIWDVMEKYDRDMNVDGDNAASIKCYDDMISKGLIKTRDAGKEIHDAISYGCFFPDDEYDDDESLS
jgi:hypothetical protein